MAERAAVPVTIEGRTYRVRGGRDPERVAHAAALVEETLKRLRARNKRRDSLELIVLAALNLAEQLAAKEQVPARGTPEVATRFDEQCDALAGQIEQALRRGEASR